MRLNKILFLLLVIMLMGCKEKSSMSWTDGVSYKGEIVSVAALKHITSLELILGCMDSWGVGGRDYCQCSVDNTFYGLSADEFIKSISDMERLSNNSEAAKEKCQDLPKQKIPQILTGAGMLGGEINMVLIKEITLDCMSVNQTEQFCTCFAQDIVPILSDKMKFIKVIDTRMSNIYEYVLQNKSMTDIVDNSRRKCIN